MVEDAEPSVLPYPSTLASKLEHEQPHSAIDAVWISFGRAMESTNVQHSSKHQALSDSWRIEIKIYGV